MVLAGTLIASSASRRPRAGGIAHGTESAAARACFPPSPTAPSKASCRRHHRSLLRWARLSLSYEMSSTATALDCLGDHGWL